jgi:hypothetical protein
MLVHLRSYHRRVKKFKHPLLDPAAPISEIEAASLVAQWLAHGDYESKSALVKGLMSSLRHLIGRYLGNWPCTRAYLDDMVSEGLLSLVKTVNNLTPDVLNGRSILHVAPMRAAKAIETMLYDLGSITGPSKRTHETYAAAGEDMPHRVAEGGLDDVSLADNSTQQEQDLIDAEDALSVMAARLQLDADLLKPEYRNMTAEEAAAHLGVHHSTILRRRAKLRSLYKVEFGG